MDQQRFDGIARLLGSAASRRSALGALLGAALLGAGDAWEAEAGRRSRRRRRRKRWKQRKNRVCFGSRVCPDPTTGHDFDDCDYSGTSIFVDANAGGSSFRRTNFANAVMDGANLQGTTFQDANLAGASMVGVDVTSATFPGACLLNADLRGHKVAPVEPPETPFALSFACNTRVTDDFYFNRDCDRLPACCRA